MSIVAVEETTPEPVEPDPVALPVSTDKPPAGHDTSPAEGKPKTRRKAAGRRTGAATRRKPAARRKAAAPKADPAPKSSAVADGVAAVLNLAAGVWAMADPVMGNALKDAAVPTGKATAKIAADNPALEALLSRFQGNSAYVELGTALAPVIMTALVRYRILPGDARPAAIAIAASMAGGSQAQKEARIMRAAPYLQMDQGDADVPYVKMDQGDAEDQAEAEYHRAVRVQAEPDPTAVPLATYAAASPQR